MPKFLDTTDFRSRRRMLEDEDFAFLEKGKPEQNDPIDPDTWAGIQDLPDDVSIRTSAVRQSTQDGA